MGKPGCPPKQHGGGFKSIVSQAPWTKESDSQGIIRSWCQKHWSKPHVSQMRNCLPKIDGIINHVIRIETFFFLTQTSTSLIYYPSKRGYPWILLRRWGEVSKWTAGAEKQESQGGCRVICEMAKTLGERTRGELSGKAFLLQQQAPPTPPLPADWSPLGAAGDCCERCSVGLQSRHPTRWCESRIWLRVR